MRNWFVVLFVITASICVVCRAHAQLGAGTTVVPKQTIAGHEIEENAVYYLELTSPSTGFVDADKFTKIELRPMSRGLQTTMTSLYLSDFFSNSKSDAAKTPWMNIQGPAARLRLTDTQPKFLVWTKQENMLRMRCSRCKVKDGFRSAKLDLKDQHLNFFQETPASQILQAGPNLFIFAIKSPLKLGEYVIAGGPDGPVVDFAIVDPALK